MKNLPASEMAIYRLKVSIRYAIVFVDNILSVNK